MCMAPRAPQAPTPRNVLQIYGRTLDLDKPGDRLDYENLQRLEAEGRIDRQGREIDRSGRASAGGASPPPGEAAPQAGSAAQRAAPPADPGPREVSRGEKEAKRRTAQQARVSGRSAALGAGSRLGQGNSAKKTLLGG